MSEEPTAKRVRTDSDGTTNGQAGLLPLAVKNIQLPQSGSFVNRSWPDSGGPGARLQPPPSTRNIAKSLESLSQNTIHNLLVQAALRHSDVLESITGAYEDVRATEQAKVIHFDCDSKAVWKKLNVEYSSLSGSKQYDRSYDVVQYIDANIKSIVRQAGPTASAGTRRNALEVLRKFGKSIVLSDSHTLGSEVRKNYQYDTSLVDGMKKIAKGMTEPERQDARWGPAGSQEFGKKLIELRNLSDSYCCFEGINDVLCILEDSPDTEDNPDEDGQDCCTYDEEDEEEEEYEEEDSEEEEYYEGQQR